MKGNSNATVHKLDLSGVACPINYVKAKLKLDEINGGEYLEIILDDGQPIKNVPLSLEQDGHKVTEKVKFGLRQWKITVKKGTCC
ncbi:response regulator sirA-like protein [Melioribacter roseus P3M-2]|uniref:Response regulator sirA-like protein n=1 Tax=Melioribacter roseus (strain DSM 23840 / JCM 17771 / VKM B-2668 / P3M-2) TaxID=1191523 RepID=I6ZYL0_MELRP|nr:sulfurtransferase TusA family protein [Melioribacter roseus]AFN74108.1 response regulator sirA-like protein [Melioribacter roseus P3M-2]